MSTYGPHADVLKEEALNLAATARERFDQGRVKLQESIANEPARALAVALGLGVLVGWWIKRR
jgi:hypothetical protein